MFRILIIDDDVDLLFLGSSLLKQRGFEVFSLSSADEAFEIVKSFNPHLILLDVKLGDQDGRNICLKLKREPETNLIKIILYSAFPETSVEYSKYGADEFIVKPYEFNHLVERIRHHLDRLPVSKS
ncbi:MAG TPA: response regulator [Chitinophagaceae bacterium]|nr:response regulator [Chitinophagaceae bacterium]